MFGWIISGGVRMYKCTDISRVQISYAQAPPAVLQDSFKRFWELEEVSQQTNILTQEEMECGEHFLKNVSREDNGKLTVSLPLKKPR